MCAERDERVPKTHDLEKVAMALDTTTAAILGNAVYDAPSGHRFRLTPYAVLFDSVSREAHLMTKTERQQAFDIVEKAAEILWKAWAPQLPDGEITNTVISSAKKRWKTAAPRQQDHAEGFVATLAPYSEIYDMACDDSAVATFDDLNRALDINMRYSRGALAAAEPQDTEDRQRYCAVVKICGIM